VIVSCLALGGFGVDTLTRLKYRHVREDQERGVTPIHVHVEAEITKGKYADYDTFLGQEAAEYVRLYLDQRRHGSPSGKIPPEVITDESPLPRADRYRAPIPLSTTQTRQVVSRLFRRAGVAKRKLGRRYDVCVHSLRKYFCTQFTALGVPAEYVEYMMGHKISRYYDIEMKGIEFLKCVYAASGLSIRPKTRVSRMEMLKEVVRAWGMDPDRVLVKEAVAEPHRTVASEQREEEQVKALAAALKEMLRREVLYPGT